MTVKYYSIPLLYDDGREEKAVIGVFDGSRPQYTAEGYGTGTSHSISEIAVYLKQETGVVISALTPIVGNRTYPEAKRLYGEKNIIANSDREINGDLSISNPYGIKIKDGYLYAKDGSQDNAQFDVQTNPGVKLSLNHQEGAIWFVNISASTKGGSSSGNIQGGGPLTGVPGAGFGGHIGLLWTDDWSFSLSGNHTRTYYFSGGTGGSDDMYISNQSAPSFYTHLLYLIAQKGKLQEYEYDNPPEEEDPQEEGVPTSGPASGEGNYDLQGDTISVPDPTQLLSAVDTGLLTIWNPDTAQLKRLAQYLWAAPVADIDWWKKLFSDPMQMLIGLSILPCRIPDGGVHELKLGTKATGINMTRAGNQHVQVNCGEIDLSLFYGSFLDFSNFTKISIFLPYIGFRDLSPEIVNGRRIGVKYNIDILSGALVCFITVNGSVMYEFSGTCSNMIPITGSDYRSKVQGLITSLAAIGVAFATGGAAAPVAATELSGAAAANAGMLVSQATVTAGIGASVTTAANMMSHKVNYPRSGAIGSEAGQMGNQKPFITLEIPRLSIPTNYKHFSGYPSNMYTNRLGDLEGYTEVEKIHLEGIPATDQELAQIKDMLQKGVVIRR